MRGAVVHAALVIGLLLVLQREHLRKAGAAARWVTYLLYGLAAAMYIATLSWPDAPRPAFFLVELLRQVSPTH